MSLEQQMEALTAALNANTQAIMGNAGTAPMQSTAQPVTTLAAAQNAQPVPAQTAAAQPTQAAAAQPVAASPSNQVQPQTVGQVAISFDQLQAEVTALYQSSNGDQRIMDTVQRYGGTLSNIAPEQYNNLLNELRGLS